MSSFQHTDPTTHQHLLFSQTLATIALLRFVPRTYTLNTQISCLEYITFSSLFSHHFIHVSSPGHMTGKRQFRDFIESSREVILNTTTIYFIISNHPITHTYIYIYMTTTLLLTPTTLYNAHIRNTP